MLSIFLVVACVAAQKEYGFSGAFVSGDAQIPAIYTYSDGSCTNDTLQYYVTFNYTFATAGVRALYTYNLYSVSVVESPNTYDLLNQCAGGNVVPLNSDNYGSSSYQTQYGHYFKAATYTFIASTSSYGAFAGEIWNGLQGQIAPGTTTNQTWMPLYESSGCSQRSYGYLYDTKAVAITSDGYYNVFVTFGQNFNLPVGYQLPYYASYSLLAGNFSGADLSTVDCTNVVYVAADQGGKLNVQTFNLWLTAGNYTFVVQADSLSDLSFYGSYALTVSRGIFVPFSSTATFLPVDRSSSDSCSTSSPSVPPCGSLGVGSNEASAAFAFTVAANSYYYVYTNEDTPSYNDLIFYIEDGNQTDAILGCGLSFKCYADSVDRAFFSGSSTQITVITTGWYSGTTNADGAALDLYILNGPLIPAGGTTLPPSSSNSPAPSAAPNNNSPAPSAAPNNNSPAPSAAPNNNPAPTTAPSRAPTSPTTTAPGTKTTAPASAPTAKAAEVSSVVMVAPGLATVFSLIGLWW